MTNTTTVVKDLPLEMTPRLTAVLDAVERHWIKYQIQPTIRYVEDWVGIPSNSTVHYYYRKLAQGGLIKLSKSKPVPKWVIDQIKKAEL